METKVDEIATGIYRLSTSVAGCAPAGFTFNQFLVLAEEPLLFQAQDTGRCSRWCRQPSSGCCRWRQLRSITSVTSNPMSAGR